MNSSRTIAAAIATAGMLAIAGCGGKADEPKASTPSSTPPPAVVTSTPSSAPAHHQSTTVPSVPQRKADKPSRRNLPRKVRRRDVENLAERFAKAWTTLELGEGDPDARRELAETITPQFAAELGRMQLQPREDLAELKEVDVIQHPGKQRWTAVVRLMRHGSTEYLQAEISRRGGRLVVTGMSW